MDRDPFSRTTSVITNLLAGDCLLRDLWTATPSIRLTAYSAGAFCSSDCRWGLTMESERGSVLKTKVIGLNKEQHLLLGLLSQIPLSVRFTVVLVFFLHEYVLSGMACFDFGAKGPL